MLYAILHHHNHGVDVDVVVSKSREPTLEEVVKMFAIDFEPQYGETIEIIPVGELDKIQTIQ